MTNILDKNTGMEKAISVQQQNADMSLSKEVKQTAEQLSEYVILGAETEGSKKVFEVVSNTGTGTTSTAQQRRHVLQEQLQKVEAMSTAQLQAGITRALNLEIQHLQKEARKIERSFSQFSAYELNRLLAKIRQIKEQIVGLMKMTIDILRELYITLVLKLRLVRA
jgi:hypothetical protein